MYFFSVSIEIGVLSFEAVAVHVFNNRTDETTDRLLEIHSRAGVRNFKMILITQLIFD